MNRFKVPVLIFFVAIFMAAPVLSLTILDSKHDLSSGSTGATIKSTLGPGGTDEVCVFCHTPHSARIDAPLWNKNMSSGTYTLYNKAFSDVLAQLGGGTYPDAESPASGTPHVKTRICLSCHDGTIALGALVNLPYGITSDIPMQGTGADYKMPQTAAGYIGLDLRDDHPIAIIHDAGKDGELKGSVTGNVWLYTAAGARTQGGTGIGYVECTSCHEPHDNQYGNFLVDSNSGSGVCASCHTKTGFTGSIHDTSTLAYAPTDGTPTGSLGTTVGEVKCMNCHFPHKAGVASSAPTTPNPSYGRYLLSFQEEASCFNNPNDRWNTAGSAGVCHGSGASGTNAIRRNIQSLVDETSGSPYKHRVADPSKAGRHRATEGQLKGWLGAGNSNWHAECEDCHNPHTSGSAIHSSGTNLVTSSGVIYGTGGVSVTSWPTWALPSSGNYSYIQPVGAVDTASGGVTKEYEVCLKCHSDFAWDIGTPPTSPSGGFAMTNQAVEFNPSNTAFHPVAAANSNPEGTGSRIAPWNSEGLTMYCSDCHTKEGSTSPVGPHGSTNPFILSSTFADTFAGRGVNQPVGDICFSCHDYNTYLTGAGTATGFRTPGGINLHTTHQADSLNPVSTYGYRCVNCHTRIPHGWHRKAMVVFQGDGAPYEAGGLNSGLILPTTILPASGNYSPIKTDNCSTVNGCHQ